MTRKKNPRKRSVEQPINISKSTKGESQFEIIEITEIALKKRAFKKLAKYPNIKPMELCKLLGLNPKKYAATLSTYKWEFRKSQSKKRAALFRLSMHRVRFFGYALRHLDIRKKEVLEKVLAAGWKQTKAYNKMLTYTEHVGRCEWFRTGRINVWVRKPATKGKLKQLLVDAFYPHLIEDINIWNEWAETFKLKGGKLVYRTGQKLPYAKISLLKDSNGVIVLIGDASHPDAVELQFIYPDWAERNELLFQQVSKFLEGLTQPRKKSPDSSRMVV